MMNSHTAQSSPVLRVVFIAEAIPSAATFNTLVNEMLQNISKVPAFAGTVVGRVHFYRYHDPQNAANPSGPGNTPGHVTLLGSTVDAGGLLGLDLDALNRITSNLALTQKMDRLSKGLVHRGPADPRTLLVVLLPAPPGGATPRARVVRRGESVVPAGTPQPVQRTAEHDFVISEGGGNTHLLVLRQIGEALSLGVEWSMPETAPDSPAFERPSPLDAAAMPWPNLIYIPADGGPALYRRSLDGLALNAPTVLARPRFMAGDSVDESQKTGRMIEALYEGGGSFRRDFFRTAPDCIMRRRLPHEYPATGSDPQSLGTAPPDLDFCPACTAHLEAVIRDAPTRAKISFDRQRTKFEQIRWANARRGEDFALALDSPTSHVVAARPANCAAGEHYFVFDLEVTPQDGMIFRNIFNERDASPDFSALHRQIAAELRFRDLRVSYVDPGGTRVTVGIDLASATVETFYGTNGTLGQDNLWHHGFLYRALVTIDNVIEVTVEQSVCFRGPTNDFDPTKAVVAIKVYPELAFSYRSINSSNTTVESFHGCVWQNLHPKSTPMMHIEPGGHAHHDHGGSGGIAENEDGIYTSWFAEINGFRNRSWLLDRTRVAPVDVLEWAFYLSHGILVPPSLLESAAAPPAAFYAGIFAYWLTQEDARPDPDQPPGAEMEAIVVRHIAQARRGRPIEATYKWRGREGIFSTGTTDEAIHVWREPREGQYDNVHNHGWMGVSRNPTSANSPQYARRMAPVCGEACVHLHVRWLFGADVLNAINNVSVCSPHAYYGWGDDPLTARPSSVRCSPLVPPNQRVRVAVTNPETSRVNAGVPAAMTTVLPGTSDTVGVRRSATLNNTNRALWYDVDIEGSIAENTKHVIFENGWGYAADHATPENGYYVLSILWLRNTAFVLGYNIFVGRLLAHQTDPFEEVMMFIYDVWLFHLHDGIQIPQGDWRNSMASNPTIPLLGVPPWNDLSMEEF